MTAFDFLAIAIIGSAIVTGFIRGGTRGLVGAGAVILGSVAALWAQPLFQPLADRIVETEWARGPLAIAIGFGLTYLVLRLIGGAIAKSVQETPGLGFADRIVGAGFGFVRAVFILGLFNIAFTTVAGEGGPDWVREAKLYPLTQASAQILRLVAPEAKEAFGNLREGMENPDKTGYDAQTTPGDSK